MAARGLLTIAAFALVLTSCAATGPRYRTRHVYSAPASAQGRTCVAVCRGNRQQCIANSRTRARECLQDRGDDRRKCYRRARIKYRNCLRNAPPGRSASARRVRATHRLYCRSALNSGRSQCNLRHTTARSSCRRGGNCNAKYRSCFRQCGGRIKTVRVCVRNCN
jgi:hypothetical protein